METLFKPGTGMGLFKSFQGKIPPPAAHPISEPAGETRREELKGLIWYLKQNN